MVPRDGDSEHGTVPPTKSMDFTLACTGHVEQFPMNLWDSQQPKVNLISSKRAPGRIWDVSVGPSWTDASILNLFATHVEIMKYISGTYHCRFLSGKIGSPLHLVATAGKSVN